MKKFLFWTALASVALTGCVKNDVEPNPSLGQDVEITFNTPVVGKVTRAEVFNEIGTDYNVNEKFLVTAWSHLESLGTFAPGNAEVYIDEKVASKTDVASGITGDTGTEGCAWHFDPIYYWPKTHYLTFSAISPSDVKELDKIEFDKEKGVSVKEVTIPSDITKQFDFMYSNRVFNQKGTDYTHTTSNKYFGVDIQFHHALASIWVNAKMDGNYNVAGRDNPQITINKMWLEDVYMTADFAEGLTSGQETDSKNHNSNKWSNHGNLQDDIYFSSNDMAIDDNTSKRYGTYAALLIPQVLEVAGAKKTTLHVTYTITNPDGVKITETQSFELAKQKDNSDPAKVIDQWQEGKRYTYTLTFGLKEIYLAPSVDAWDDVTMSDINI